MTIEKLTLKFYNKLNGTDLENYEDIPNQAREFLSIYNRNELVTPLAGDLMRNEKEKVTMGKLSFMFGIQSEWFFRQVGSRIGVYKAKKKVKFL